MITNMNHVGEGKVRFTLTDGRKLRTTVSHNDTANQVFWLEVNEGAFEPLPYAAVAHATIALNR